MGRWFSILVTCFILSGMSAPANAQRIKEFAGKVSALHHKINVVEITNNGNKSERFKVDPQLMRKTGLTEGKEVTVFYRLADQEKEITGIQIGNQMWHQKDCSRDDCKCTSYGCEPKCHCRGS